MQQKKKKKAFTLTELLVVVIVIASLSAIIVPKYQKVLETQKTGEADAIMRAVRTEQERRCTIGKQYTSLSNMSDLVPQTSTKNFSYSMPDNNSSLIATSSGKYKYKLQMLSFRDGRVCCADVTAGDCDKLNKNYPKCSEIEGSLATAPECTPDGEDIVTGSYEPPPPTDPCLPAKTCSDFAGGAYPIATNGGPTCSNGTWSWEDVCYNHDDDDGTCGGMASVLHLENVTQPSGIVSYNIFNWGNGTTTYKVSNDSECYKTNPCDEQQSCPVGYRQGGSPKCTQENGWDFSECFYWDDDCSSCTNTALLRQLDFDTDNVYNRDGSICYRYKVHPGGVEDPPDSYTSETCSQCPSCDAATNGTHPYGNPTCQAGSIIKDNCYRTENRTYSCYDKIGSCTGGTFSAPTKIFYSTSKPPEPPDFSTPFAINGCYALAWSGHSQTYKSCNNGNTWRHNCGPFIPCSHEGDECIYKEDDGQCFAATCTQAGSDGNDHLDWGETGGGCSMESFYKLRAWGIDTDPWR